MKIIFLISTLLLLPQSALACYFPSDWQMMNSQSNSSLEVAAKLPSQPINTGEQFNIDVLVCGGAAGIAQVKFDATMPAHKHGMNYIPEVSKLDASTYRGSGLFFHMPGKWHIIVDIKDQKTHRFYLGVAAK